MQIGGVCDGEEEALAAFHQGQNAVLLQKLLAHRTNGVHIGGDGVKIEERHAEFVRGRNGDVACGRQIRGHQIGHQVGALFLCLGDGVAHRGLVQEAILDQPMREPTERGAIGAADGYRVVIHGLKSTPEPRTISLPPATGGQLSNQPQWSHMAWKVCVTSFPISISAASPTKEAPPMRGPPDCMNQSAAAIRRGSSSAGRQAKRSSRCCRISSRRPGSMRCRTPRSRRSSRPCPG